MINIKKNLLVLLLFFSLKIFGQIPSDSTDHTTTFSGTIGITNNGFSIIPTFSLNKPATIINLSWKRKKFSFEPDIRLVANASKGGMLFWLRYKLVEQKKFGIRIGGHPAFSYIRRTLIENGKSTEITEMLRFAAFEFAPNYQFTKHFGVSAMYLNGNGLQNHGPQHTHVLFLNTSFTNLKIGGNFRFNLHPTVYFLKVDKTNGQYFAVTGVVSNLKFPINLHSTINQTFTSNISGNQDFMWNIGLSYAFSKSYKRVK